MNTLVKSVFVFGLLLLSVVQAQRIRVEGNKFYTGDNPVFMLGANTPWNNWNEFGRNFSADWWNTHFKAMHDSGLNCTRVWVSCNGDNASPGISASGSVSEPTEQFWNDMTSLFEIAQNNGIYLMIALISFDHTKEGNTNADAWRAMYNDADNRQSFVDNYAVPFVEKFGDNPYFWSIDVGNELDWVHENDDVAIDNVFDLAARVANGVHANSEVLVTLGTGAGPKYLSPTYGTNHYSDAELQKLQPGAYLDFYDNHFYDWMTEWFSTPFVNGPSDWEIDEKPCVIGEYAANGHGDGYSPAQCLEKAAALGWQGVMPWTSNGVDDNGSLSDFGSAFKTWCDANSDKVFPPKESDPGPFTLTVTEPEGGTISISPEKTQYDRGEEVALSPVPDEDKEFQKWSGDLSGTEELVTITITRNMTISAVFKQAGELVRNGTFDNGTTGWSLGQGEGYGNSVAAADVADGRCQVSITEGGEEEWHVQVIQAGMQLVAQNEYVFSFDAAAEEQRSMFVAVGEADGEYTKFFEKTIDLTDQIQSFSFRFTPSASSDNVRVEFNIGNFTIGVSLDNVSLKSADDAPVRYAVTNKVQAGAITIHRVKDALLVRAPFAETMFIEGCALNGKRLFVRKGNVVDGMVSIPLKSHLPQVMAIRCIPDQGKGVTRKIVMQR